MTKWTSDQQKVIDYRNRNILVSAAAGSGKTAVLVERIIKRITEQEHPVDIDKLLVVTFTKAAAAEMRERISNAIDELLKEYPDDENLRKQHTLVHNAQITTIDSFCLHVVRNHFEEINLDPNFRVADQGELKLLEMDVLNEVFENEYARTKGMNREEEPFLQLADAYSDKRSNRAVKEMVAKIYRQSASNPWPKEWIAGLAQNYRVETKEELLQTDFMKGILPYIKAVVPTLIEKAENLKEIALQPDGPLKYADTLDKDIVCLEKILELQTYEEMETYFAGLKFATLARLGKTPCDEQKKEAVKEGRETIKKEIQKIKKRYFEMSLESFIEQLKTMRPIVEELIRLSLLYIDAIKERKKEKHLMDFSDIEHAALRIFVDETTKERRPTALEYQKQLEEIMIDEYQDSNQVQEEIMCAIARDDNMFMVGDVKQSIYRFRLARPELFMEKFATYHLEEHKNQRIDLHKNFRSRNEVLEFTNDIFYKIMDSDLGKVKYDEDAALYCGASYPEAEAMKAEVLLYAADMENLQETDDTFYASIELEEIQRKERELEIVGEVSKKERVSADVQGIQRIENISEEMKEFNKKQLEARMIAERILELKQELQVTVKGTNELRPLQNRDIVILLRSLKGWGNEFAQVLSDCGIPAHVTTSTGYFSAVEVQTVLSFLKILDNPYQDIPMAAVLKSAIVGLDNEELAELSLTENTNSFAESAIKQMEEATEGKLYRFYQLFQMLRQKVSDTPIHHLIDMVLDLTGYGDYVKALPAGGQRKANLDMLVEKAIAYEKTSYKGLFHFIRYIDQLQKYEVDFGEADIIGENEDVVRIMTIHKSKGLEFPVVFVAGCSKEFNQMDTREKMVIHPDMGIGMKERLIEPRIERECLVRSEIATRIRMDNLGEELRVLYVAMTRAKEKLILTGTVDDLEKFHSKTVGMAKKGHALNFHQRLEAKCYMDWIAPAVLSYPEKYDFTYKNDTDFILAEAKKLAEQQISKEELLAEIAQADDALVETYQQQFAYQYPYQQEAGRKSKYSVSEIKHDSMVEKYDRMEGQMEIPDFLLEEREPYIPEFAKDLHREEIEKDSFVSETEQDLYKNEDMVLPYGVSIGALRGTAVHRVMECINFAAFLQVNRESKREIYVFIENELTRMKEQKQIEAEQLSLVSKKSLYQFFCSETALRMAQADARGDFFCEKPFVMDYNGVLVQGIIDVFWLEGDKIVLLDYKTDRVEHAEELKTRYQTQLDLYAQALRRIFSHAEQKIEKTENLIYSFCLHETITL